MGKTLRTKGFGPYGAEFLKWFADTSLTTIDKFVEKYLSHQVLGFTARVAVAGGVCLVGLSTGYRTLEHLESHKPIAKRWMPRWTEITLIDKTPMEAGSDIVVFRFALPNTYDTLGYTPISSVLVSLPRPRNWYKAKKRWYTPISHPEQRGVVEFAVKLKEPGYMSQELRSMPAGGKLYLGPWVKEYRYKANAVPVVDFLCAGAGVTPFLQLAACAIGDRKDRTKLRLLFCNKSPETTPFFKRLCELEKQHPERVELKFLADHGRWDKHPAGLPAAQKGWTGTISKDFLERWLAGPTYILPAHQEALARGHPGAALGHPDGVVGDLYRRQVLISGPGAFMTYLCGRATMIPFMNYYFKGPYTGMLKDMGFTKSQLYIFANPWTVSTQS